MTDATLRSSSLRSTSELRQLAEQERDAHAVLDRANRAQRLIEDELFKAAVEAVKDQLWREFAETRIDDDATRKNARIGIDMLDRILKSLRKHMGDGTLARESLSRIEKRKRFLNR